MADEEFHEIQLNGKQLVFLFMAGTVAAVVIFLSGLMVGRNIRNPRAEAAAPAVESTIADPTRPTDVPPPPTTAEAGTPASINEKLTYDRQLEGPAPVDDDFTPASAAKAADKTAGRNSQPEKKDQPEKTETRAVENPVPIAPAKAASPAPVVVASSRSTIEEPAGNGWTVQVQAVKTRDEADAIARRLNAKGYPTFVSSSGAGMYRVRVGKYPNKRDAEAMKATLEKKEQFKPWVTR